MARISSAQGGWGQRGEGGGVEQLSPWSPTPRCGTCSVHSCEEMHVCCSGLPSVWSFVTAAQEIHAAGPPPFPARARHSAKGMDS